MTFHADEFRYKSFIITDYGLGLRPFDNKFGFVTSYLAKNYERRILCGFAFAIDGFLLNRCGSQDSEGAIISRAKEAIILKIDSDIIEDSKEYTFEYCPCDTISKFIEVDEAMWWLSSTLPRGH